MFGNSQSSQARTCLRGYSQVDEPPALAVQHEQCVARSARSAVYCAFKFHRYQGSSTRWWKQQPRSASSSVRLYVYAIMDSAFDIGEIVIGSASGCALEVPVDVARAVHLLEALGQIVEHVQHHVEAALREPPPARAPAPVQAVAGRHSERRPAGWSCTAQPSAA